MGEDMSRDDRRVPAASQDGKLAKPSSVSRAFTLRMSACPRPIHFDVVAAHWAPHRLPEEPPWRMGFVVEHALSRHTNVPRWRLSAWHILQLDVGSQGTENLLTLVCLRRRATWRRRSRSTRSPSGACSCTTTTSTLLTMSLTPLSRCSYVSAPRNKGVGRNKL